MRVLFFGMGYSSLAVAHFIKRNINEDIEIIGTIRDEKSTSKLIKNNIKPIIFDGENISTELNKEIASATHIIHSIAPNDLGDVVFNHYKDQLEVAKNLKWMCYFSTIGVYGNQNGNWIDESATTNPKNLRSIKRIKIENLWQNFARQHDMPLLTLRLAGIYGNGRSVFDKLKNGTAKRIIKQNQVFNRIHVKDIARVTTLCAQKNISGTYNLCDNEPAPPQEVVEFAANLSGLAAPTAIEFEKANMSEIARSFYNDNKKVSNVAIKQKLNIELLYPTYREGLKAIISNV